MNPKKRKWEFERIYKGYRAIKERLRRSNETGSNEVSGDIIWKRTISILNKVKVRDHWLILVEILKWIWLKMNGPWDWIRDQKNVGVNLR